MSRTELEVATPDGTCRASLCRPPGTGPWPGVLMFHDGIGYRPAMFEIAETIAAHGYVVLVPDLFYRMAPYTAVDPGLLFSDETVRADWWSRTQAALDPARAMTDARFFIDCLIAQPDVRGPRIGTTGYCMGARLSFSTAGTYPENVVACAGFHPGRIATDEPSSPHLLAPTIKARVFIAGATNDPTFPDAMKQRLVDALASAHVTHTVETWPARHGWVPRDTAVHDPVQAERHFQALFSLFDQLLSA